MDRSTLQQIDACRPGSDDLNSPELAELAELLATDPLAAELYRRIQELDGRIVAAFSDAPVPPGLADRLLDRLGLEAIGLEAGNQAMAADAAAPSTPGATDSVLMGPGLTGPVEDRSAVPRLSIEVRSRRRWLVAVGGGLAAVAATVFLTLNLHHPPKQEITAERLLDAAVSQFLAELDRDSNDDPALATMPDALKRRFPVARQLQRFNDVRWREVNLELSERGDDADMAYRFVAPNGRIGIRATLYITSANVVGAETTGLDDAPPLDPMLQTGGIAAAAWRDGDLVYVLVIQGGLREYQHVLDRQGMPAV